MLEPCAGKLASSVLRGRSGSNATLLPDYFTFEISALTVCMIDFFDIILKRIYSNSV